MLKKFFTIEAIKKNPIVWPLMFLTGLGTIIAFIYMIIEVFGL